ncbi:MAG: glycoside hydrolase family 16 protein [Clostridia bacterium]|nr:glycoside hydrolase family 16 protein [Clostridia bacterium]
MSRMSVRRGIAWLLVLCLVPLSACGAEPDASAPATTTSFIGSTTTPITTESSITTTTSVTTREETTMTTLTTAATTTAAVTETSATTTATVTKIPTTTTTAKPEKQWELFWSDEFEGNRLDTSKWNVELGANGAVAKRAENVQVADGNCVITLRRDSSVPGYEYSSAWVTTAGKFSFQYGRLEFRAKLPYGQGVWPALWTMGDYYLTTSDELGWPRCGEIDVMELIGEGGAGEANVCRPNRKVTCNLHWGGNRDAHQENGGGLYLPEAASEDYHVYAIEWDEREIVWFVDDMEINRVKLDDPTMLDAFAQKHWLIMNVALCDWDPYRPDDRTPLPQSMYVDYVRVYKEKK